MTALSSAGMNGAATKSRAATSPLANEPATIQPICPLGSEAEGDGRPNPSSGMAVGTESGGVVTMNLEFIPMASREDSHLHSLHVPRFRHYAFRTDMHP